MERLIGTGRVLKTAAKAATPWFPRTHACNKAPGKKNQNSIDRAGRVCGCGYGGSILLHAVDVRAPLEVE